MTLGLTVLGGAAAWPNPGQGCSAYLATSSESSILLDCGPNTLLELRKHIDYHTVDAVILSHCHVDHMLDLVPYRYGLKYGMGQTTRRIPLWVPPGGIERLHLLGDALTYGSGSGMDFWSDAFDLREYDPTVELGISDISLSFAPTQHFVPCYAMRVTQRDGIAFGYSADAGTIEPLVELMRGVALVLVEATERDHAGRPVESRGHLTPEDAGQLAADSNAGTLLVTHLWCERSDDEVVSAARAAFDGSILVAKPGLHVAIG